MNTVRNTDFDNHVNYPSDQSSIATPCNFDMNSVDPTSLSNLMKSQPIVEYHLIETVEKTIEDPSDQ